MKTKRPKDIHSIFSKDLKDKEIAAAYLRGCLEDGPDEFNIAVLNVLKAHGNIAKLSASLNLSRTGLYRSLSEDGKPAFESIHKLLTALGFKFEITANDKKEAA
jgi:probable addiction module antidote protein